MRHLQTTPSKESKGRLHRPLGFTYVVIEPDISTAHWPTLRTRYPHHEKRTRNNYVRQIIEACGANVIAFDEAGKVVYANQSWKDFALANALPSDDQSFGLSSLTRSRPKTSSPCFSAVGFLDDMQWLFSTKQLQFENEYVLKCSKGSRSLLVRVSCLDDQTTASTGVRMLATLEDVTEKRRSEDELRNLSGRLINAQEQERSRVARDLHDNVMQQLAVLTIELEQLRRTTSDHQSALSSTVRLVLSRARELASDIHQLSYQLHPFKLDHLGLSAALKNLCEEISDHHDLRINYRHKGSATLTSEITLCLFRIAQEALNNIVKHSGARGANVILTTTENIVRLQVLDKGRGFDVESPKVKGRLGLTSMKERLRLVGGEISIQSQRGLGTRVDAFIPL